MNKYRKSKKQKYLFKPMADLGFNTIEWQNSSYEDNLTISVLKVRTFHLDSCNKEAKHPNCKQFNSDLKVKAVNSTKTLFFKRKY